MKTIFIFLIMLLGSISGYSEIKRVGNTFITTTSTQSDKATPYLYTDKNGKSYTIYISPKGSCYIKKISKKSGKEYKHYLPKEVQEQIQKELGYVHSN